MPVQHLLANIDYVAERYQTLFVGAAAFYLAFKLNAFTRRQVAILEEQHRMAVEKAKTNRALATLTIDRFVVAAFRVIHNMIIHCGMLNQDNNGNPMPAGAEQRWDAEAFGHLTNLDIPEKATFDAYAAVAFPSDAPALVQFRDAFVEVANLEREFTENPWIDHAPRYQGDRTARDYEMAERKDRAISRLWEWQRLVAKLQPHARSTSATDLA